MKKQPVNQALNTGGFNKKKPSNVIQTADETAFRTKSKEKKDIKENRNSAYNYNRLQ